MTNKKIRWDFLALAPNHLKQGTFRQEVENLLKNQEATEALIEIELDDSLTNQFIFALSRVEGMPVDSLDDYMNHLIDYMRNPAQAQRDLEDPATPPLRWFALRIHQAAAAQQSMDPLGYMTHTEE